MGLIIDRCITPTDEALYCMLTLPHPVPAPTADLRSGAKGSREVVLKPAVTYKMSSILVYSKIIGQQRSAHRHVLRDWRIGVN